MKTSPAKAPPAAEAAEGTVLLDGAGVALTMTPAAAESLAKRLQSAADEARSTELRPSNGSENVSG